MRKAKFRIPDDFIGQTTGRIANILRNMDDVILRNSMRIENSNANEYISSLKKLLSFFS
jgi:hypothetical protein